MRWWLGFVSGLHSQMPILMNRFEAYRGVKTNMGPWNIWLFLSVEIPWNDP